MKRVIETLTEIHLECCGGYPYDWVEHEGMVFIAGLDDGRDRNATRLDAYEAAELHRWEKRAEGFQRDNPSKSWDNCVFETQEAAPQHTVEHTDWYEEEEDERTCPICDSGDGFIQVPITAEGRCEYVCDNCGTQFSDVE